MGHEDRPQDDKGHRGDPDRRGEAKDRQPVHQEDEGPHGAAEEGDTDSVERRVG